LNSLLDYFDLIAFDRFMKYIQSFPTLMALRSNEKHALQGLADFDALVSSVDKAYDVVKKIFASDKKTEIINSITTLGFDNFE
jgi:ornithine carbamoyltransferase